MNKQQLTPVVINGEVYYCADQLKEYAPEYFYGCTKNPKKIVEIKGIPKDQYVYASQNKSGYTLYSDNVSEAPPLIHIDNEIKFRDEEGNVVEIEMRGERNMDNIYFLARDVATGFNIHKLQDIVKAKGSSYICGEDYVYFLSKDANNRIQKMMYLTYEGIFRVLARSRKVKHFDRWAMFVLFETQSSFENKKEAVTDVYNSPNILGINVRTIRESLSVCATPVPCVYLFSLGICKDLRKSMSLTQDIPDDYIIVKYGFTNDLNRRSGEHSTKYGKLDGVQLELLQYTYIDPVFLANAETDIGNFFKDIEIPLTYDTQKELVAVNPSHIKQILKQYRSMKTLYTGHLTEITKEVERLNHEKEVMVERQKAEIEKKNAEIEKYKAEVQVQAMENKYLKIMIRMKMDVSDLEQGLSGIKL